MQRHKQISFFKTDWKHQYNHGGQLRQKRKGRKRRPLSCSEPLHVVFKINREQLLRKSLRDYKNFALVKRILARYAKRFFIKVEQVSVQADHIHCLVRTSRRSHFHYFFRVTAGQIAQQFQNKDLLELSLLRKVTDTPQLSNDGKKGKIIQKQVSKGQGSLKLWKYRPFSRVVKGWKAYKIVRNYIQLNEKEALGRIGYRKERQKGLSLFEWSLLWS
jgi:putative transposase